MREQPLQFLEKLVNTPSPSGHEYRGQRVWLDYVKQYADETFSDSYGNVKATATAQYDGYWRFNFAGTTTTPAVSATGDYVDVK